MSEPDTNTSVDNELIALMTSYQAGSLAAFEQLHTALAPPLHGYFRAHASAGTLAVDLVQDTFLELHRSRRTYQPGRPVRAWAFGIAHHVLLRHRDSERRRARHEAAQLPGQRMALEGVPADADLLHAEMRDVNAALHALSPATRDAWLMHHVHGKGFDEIAHRLGIATTAARLRASRATAAIRRALGMERGPSHG